MRYRTPLGNGLRAYAKAFCEFGATSKNVGRAIDKGSGAFGAHFGHKARLYRNIKPLLVDF